MRIGFDATALPSRPVGAGKYIIELVRALANSPAISELIVFAHQSRIPLFGIQETTKLHFIQVKDKPIPLRLAWEQIMLPALGSRYSIDLLHSPHYTMPWFAPFPVVTTFHDMTFFLFPELHTPIKRIFFPLMMRVSGRRAKAVIADSETTRRDALRILGIPPEKITTIFLGASADFHPVKDTLKLAQIRRRYGLPEKYVLYVGAVEPRKNLPLLISAFEQASLQNPDWHMVVVGRQGWRDSQGRHDLSQLAFSERVHFIGYVPEEDLPSIYTLAGMLVYPSIYEGFGLPVLEAMACGTSVITTRSSAMAEIASEVGIMVPPLDLNGLAEAIRTIIQNPEKRQELSAQALERAALFTWEKTAANTAAVYKQILEKH